MKIPKYVEELIQRRQRYAEMLNSVASQLDDWLLANNIECSSDSWQTGCAIYADPGSAAESVRQSISQK